MFQDNCNEEGLVKSSLVIPLAGNKPSSVSKLCFPATSLKRKDTSSSFLIDRSISLLKKEERLRERNI